MRVVQGCTIAVAQSRYARMHKDSHTKPLHDATAQMAVDAQMQRPQRPQFDNPATLSPAQQARYYFWRGGRENPQLAGKAWMPYKMNAQSFARMRNQQSVHKRAKDARWRSPKVVMQGCIKTATQSRCTMQRHKWLSMHRCGNPNG